MTNPLEALFAKVRLLGAVQFPGKKGSHQAQRNKALLVWNVAGTGCKQHRRHDRQRTDYGGDFARPSTVSAAKRTDQFS